MPKNKILYCKLLALAIIRPRMKIKTSLLVLGSLISPSFAALYSADHGDIGIAYEDEGDGPEFFLHYHLGGNAILDGSPVGGGEEGEEFEPGDITTLVPASTQATMGNVAILNTGTGVSNGSPIWILPQGEDAGVPFLGIAAEELDGELFPGGATFKLIGVTSPSGNGDFSVWQQSGIRQPEFFFSTNSPGDTADNNQLSMSSGGHDHFNYGFSEPGMWEVELSVSGMLNGTDLLTDTETFSFQVGSVPEPSTALLSFLGALSLFRRRR